MIGLFPEWDLGLSKWRKGAEKQGATVALFFLIVDMMSPAASSPSCLDFPAMRATFEL